jgi:hypothetical protein
MREEDQNGAAMGGAQPPQKKEGETGDNTRHAPYDDDDENDTVDQVRHRTSDCPDESMMTARIGDSSPLVAPFDASSNHRDDDSHSRSFASCDSYDQRKMVNILTDNSSTLDLLADDSEHNKMINVLADSDVDLNESENDSTSNSEYSANMDFSSLQNPKGLERQQKTLPPEPPSETPEGAPHKKDTTSSSSPSGHVAKVRRVSRAERSELNLSTEASPRQPLPLRASAPSTSEEGLEYGKLSPVRASTGGGGLFKGKPSAASRFRPSLRKTVSFGRAHTSEGIPERTSFIERAKLEQFAIDLDGEKVTESHKFKRKFRSRSMDMAGSCYSADSFAQRKNTVSNSNRVSVAFGASREQSHYQPVVIRKTKQMDILTGGEIARDVLCQRIIDYPEAMDPNERRRKTVVRTKKENTHQRSMHGITYEPQYRIQTRVHAQHRVSCIGPEFVTSLCLSDVLGKPLNTTLPQQFDKEQMLTETAEPGLLTRYLIWSLRTRSPIVLLSQAFAFWATICVFTVCIYIGGLYQPQCIQGPRDMSFDESGSYFIDAFALSWTTFATVVRLISAAIIGNFFQVAQSSCIHLKHKRDMELFILRFGGNLIKLHSTALS